ncbi:hypothetical protein PMIN04_012858 [Paraphaeosphaeria minitans]|uniref:Uncharacterized protein n=1 Tax=Paraphaeosphaeria minitans TaxID=565426 RepID=A0A9P6GDZ4_9PLEO|nr:hypothetical protein PMIN01_08185 [Paraphaeosphaeria minitans]
MAKKKNKNIYLKLGRTVEGDEAIELVAPTVNPESLRAEPEATAIPKSQAEQTPLSCQSFSPYASEPVTINVGPAPITYYVPWHLLESTNWSTVPAGGEISLPTINADTGHTLVHYLYTGAYQTLKSRTSGIAQNPQLALKQALLIYRVSATHMLDGLEQLAKQEIEQHSASMDLKTMLDIIRSELPKKTEPSDWIQAYLKDKTQLAFEKDHTVFADDAFCASLCKKSKLNDYIVRHVVKLLSEKLTQTLTGPGNIAKELNGFPRPLPVLEETVADKDPFAGLSKKQKKKLEKKMRQEEEERAQLEKEEAKAAALAQYGYVGDNTPLSPNVGEKPAPVEKPETSWEASALASEPETTASEHGPCYKDSIVAVVSEPPIPEPINQEEKEAPCEEPAPTSNAHWGDSALPAESDSSWEHAVLVPVDEADAIYDDSIPVAESTYDDSIPVAESTYDDSIPVAESTYDHSNPVEPESLYEIPELKPVSDYPREAVSL